MTELSCLIIPIRAHRPGFQRTNGASRSEKLGRGGTVSEISETS